MLLTDIVFADIRDGILRFSTSGVDRYADGSVVADGEVWLGVDGTVPYLDYTIISGETPNDLKPDYFAEVVEGDGRSEIAIGTPESPKRRFFKVKRAE